MSGKDAKIAEEIFKKLSSAYDFIQNEKNSSKAQDEDVCKIVEEALKTYEELEGKNKEKSKSSSKSNSNTTSYSKSENKEQNSKNNNTQKSTKTQQDNQRKTNNTSQNTRKSEVPPNYKTKFKYIQFNNGTLEKILEKDGTQRILENQKYKIYGYIFTDTKGTKHRIYSEDDFQKLANPKYKTIIEQQMFSEKNLENANLYDVQNKQSQYGYVGKVEIDEMLSSIVPDMNRLVVNPELVETLRKAQLIQTKELKFNGGTLKKAINKDGIQKIKRTHDNSIVVYGYIYRDRFGKESEIYTEETFEDLSKPRFKKIIEQELLSAENIERANMYDVQDKNSQYGYVGGMNVDYLISSIMPQIEKTKLNPELIEKLRNIQLKQTQELKFNGGTLKKLLNKDGKQVIEDIVNKSSAMNSQEITRIYGYIFKNAQGKEQEIFSENDFEALSNPDYKKQIEREMLSAQNLAKANSYDVQNKNSQYGYVGKIDRNYFSHTNILSVSKKVISTLRNLKLQNTKKLRFNDNTLEKMVDDKGRQIALDIENIKLYVYKLINNETSTVVYTQNSFSDLANPENKFIIAEQMLTKTNIARSMVRDTENEKYGYGYIGDIEYRGFDGRGFYIYNPEILKTIIKHEKGKTKLRIALDKEKRQKTITLKDGKKLYGYNLASGVVENDEGQDFYFENDAKDMQAQIEEYKKSHYGVHDLDWIWITALYKAMDNTSKNGQYGYAGLFTSSGKIKVNKEIVKELKEVVEKIKSKKEKDSLEILRDKD